MNLYITMPRGELRDSFLGEGALDILAEHFSISLNDLDRNLDEDELAQAAKDFDVLVTGWGTANLKKARLTENGMRLKLLVHTGGSVGDLIDQDAYDNGLRVISGNRIYAESTAEGALSYILAGLRYIPHEVSAMKDSSYWDSPRRTQGLFGKNIGIIGVGAVSKSLMSYLKPFRAHIKVYDTYEVDRDFLASVGAEQVPLEELLLGSDIVSVHAALGESTRGMIGARELSMIRDGALLVNTSRGPIIDEDALERELESGRIRAVLDVFTHEPLSADSVLRRLDNVYLIPHRAGPTYDLRGIIGKSLAEDTVRYLNGEKLEFEIDRESAARMTKH